MKGCWLSFFFCQGRGPPAGFCWLGVRFLSFFREDGEPRDGLGEREMGPFQEQKSQTKRWGRPVGRDTREPSLVLVPREGKAAAAW